MSVKGMVATGHDLTAKAAADVLRDGGNAFDAAIAAFFTACVAEPILASLGGGGFLLAGRAGSEPMLYDFFVQTPCCKRPTGELDFRSITADFGSAHQEFHIGYGTIATPGCVKGMFRIHRELGSLPLDRLIKPAVSLARQGVAINRSQAEILQIVQPICVATPEARAIYCRPGTSTVWEYCDVMRQEALADSLDGLAEGGEDFFYAGPIAKALIEASAANGGQLSARDFLEYEAIRRTPLELRFRDARILTNPLPSSGGILIAFGLALLEQWEMRDGRFGDLAHLSRLAEVIQATELAWKEVTEADGNRPGLSKLLSSDVVQKYRREVLGRVRTSRGTTHMSILDSQGNAASMTVSNGEGCGTVLPEFGIMFNNMLGEQDLNRTGFQQWAENQRLTSMMAPTMIETSDGSRYVTGSGGSNRIRTTILQVIINLVHFGMTVADAVTAPRIHVEAGKLSVEHGFDTSVIKSLTAAFEHHEIWSQQSLYFGGAHTVGERQGRFTAAGDPRRGGCLRIV